MANIATMATSESIHKVQPMKATYIFEYHAENSSVQQGLVSENGRDNLGEKYMLKPQRPQENVRRSRAPARRRYRRRERATLTGGAIPSMNTAADVARTNQSNNDDYGNMDRSQSLEDVGQTSQNNLDFVGSKKVKIRRWSNVSSNFTSGQKKRVSRPVRRQSSFKNKISVEDGENTTHTNNSRTLMTLEGTGDAINDVNTFSTAKIIGEETGKTSQNPDYYPYVRTRSSSCDVIYRKRRQPKEDAYLKRQSDIIFDSLESSEQNIQDSHPSTQIPMQQQGSGTTFHYKKRSGIRSLFRRFAGSLESLLRIRKSSRHNSSQVYDPFASFSPDYVIPSTETSQKNTQENKYKTPNVIGENVTVIDPNKRLQTSGGGVRNRSIKRRNGNHGSGGVTSINSSNMIGSPFMSSTNEIKRQDDETESVPTGINVPTIKTTTADEVDRAVYQSPAPMKRKKIRSTRRKVPMSESDINSNAKSRNPIMRSKVKGFVIQNDVDDHQSEIGDGEKYLDEVDGERSNFLQTGDVNLDMLSVGSSSTPEIAPNSPLVGYTRRKVKRGVRRRSDVSPNALENVIDMVRDLPSSSDTNEEARTEERYYGGFLQVHSVTKTPSVESSDAPCDDFLPVSMETNDDVIEPIFSNDLQEKYVPEERAKFFIHSDETSPREQGTESSDDGLETHARTDDQKTSSRRGSEVKDQPLTRKQASLGEVASFEKIIQDINAIADDLGHLHLGSLKDVSDPTGNVSPDAPLSNRGAEGADGGSLEKQVVPHPPNTLVRRHRQESWIRAVSSRLDRLIDGRSEARKSSKKKSRKVNEDSRTSKPGSTTTSHLKTASRSRSMKASSSRNKDLSFEDLEKDFQDFAKQIRQRERSADARVNPTIP